MKYILNDERGKRIELENKELCTACEGICCKNMGCHYSRLREAMYNYKVEIDD